MHADIDEEPPNAATLVTVPSRIMPRLRSFSVSTPSLNTAALKAGRGSRPGFSSSRKMSVTVGRPKGVVHESLRLQLAHDFVHCRSAP